MDICEGRKDPGRILMMKDITLLKTGVTGERLYNKIQDFMWDELLFQYISLPEARLAYITLSINKTQYSHKHVHFLDCRHCILFYRTKYNGYAHHAYQ